MDENKELTYTEAATHLIEEIGNNDNVQTPAQVEKLLYTANTFALLAIAEELKLIREQADEHHWNEYRDKNGIPR